ncbi:uncharacterized protein T551_03021 [Pneumocystis jirovecii RU7]|uniref:Uncharacterized protein n=1 Tax=Pneumocystis jirovecii (strain RU7) TaxID=1408657 RepID=A0A0W4ZGM3_PNEJ7|nr:uncharacterized protein T551_03021 [Pneumocystis jirovecii RU7]KTW27522.1 hypothetical protein T551_03021 [Pneumocystis jirovecii RU7]
MIQVFQKKRVEIALFLDQTVEYTKCGKEFFCMEKLLFFADQSLKFLANINDFLKQMNQEEIEHVSSGMKDRKIVLRLFECVMSLCLSLSQRYTSILDHETHDIMSKTLDRNPMKNTLWNNEKLMINNSGIFEQMICVFDNILKNDVFMNTFNIKEKSVLCILNIYGELGFGPASENKNWLEKFYSLLER